MPSVNNSLIVAWLYVGIYSTPLLCDAFNIAPPGGLSGLSNPWVGGAVLFVLAVCAMFVTLVKKGRRGAIFYWFSGSITTCALALAIFVAHSGFGGLLLEAGFLYRMGLHERQANLL